MRNNGLDGCYCGSRPIILHTFSVQVVVCFLESRLFGFQSSSASDANPGYKSSSKLFLPGAWV